MDKEKAKREIANLVKKYDRVVEENRVKKYNEEMTKKDFILPLFRALGWSVEDSNEVTAEEKISKKRVDYGFRIDGIPKFFLEAKSLKVDLDDERFFEQAVSYAWHKGCTWAVLTDFEAVKILNAEWKAANYLQSHFTTFRFHEFLKRFDELWLLSKDSFEKGLLDKEAEKWGKKTKKTSIDKQLLADFTRFRGMLSRNIIKLNQSKNLTEEELDESVQRILDRLIFIRNCEDRELEAKTLISSVRDWRSKGKGRLVESLRQVFGYFDKEYNSKIFAEHLCDNLEIEGEVLYKIVMGLYYTREKYFSISYDFSAIDADVLGNIYEQYLSHILKKTEKRAKLAENHARRKEQGIYYTPTYIVDYIVRNTLGELLKDKKVNAEKVRVLDPACGSGSFLIKAFDVLNEYHLRNDKDYAQSQLDSETGATFTKRARILQSNIFGVDLDKQAVEIAQLNLLLKIAEKGHRLPFLERNIKCGNSLIDNEKVAGNKAFKWETEFPEIMKKGCFDVVIGNPPYIRQEELLPIKTYLRENYEVFHSTADLFVYFFERGLKNLKENGYFGIVVSNKWLKAGYGKNLRKLLSDYWIEEFIDFGDLRVFQEATTYPCIIIVRKIKKQNPEIRVCQVKTLKFSNLASYVEQNRFTANQSSLDINGWNFSSRDVARLLARLESENISLREYVDNQVYYGIKTGFNEAYIIDGKKRDELVALDPKYDEIIEPFVSGAEVRRFGIDSKNQYIILAKIGVDLTRYPVISKHFLSYKQQLEKRTDQGKKWYELRPCSYYSIFDKPRIMFSEVQVSPKFTFDTKRRYANKTIFSIPRKDIALVGVLNSKLAWFLIQNYCNRVRGGYILSWKYLGRIPVPRTLPTTLTELAKKMLQLNRKLLSLRKKKTDERAELEVQIRKIDSQIDELVYEIYEIDETERKIIEASL